MLVRLISVLAIAASLWPLEFAALRRHAGLIAVMGTAYLLVLIQLVPLPPALWGALPGHAIYARIAEESGSIGWRPLSLAPDLTANTLAALLPASAACLATIYLDSAGRWKLLHWLVGLAAISAALGLVQLAAGGTALHFYRESSEGAPVGIFANRNHQAVFLACSLPLVGALIGLKMRDGASPRLVAAAAVPLVVLLLVTLLLTGSRMGMLLGFAGLAGAVCCYRASGHAILAAAKAARWPILGIAAGTLATVAFAAMRGGAIDRLAHPDMAGETRAAMFHPLLETVWAYMPLGAGFGSFESVYRRFEPDALLSTIYMNQAHDEPLQLAIEGGLPALAVLLVFGWWWAKTATHIVSLRGSIRERTIGLAAIIICAMLMMSSLVDYPLRTPLLGALFMIALVEMSRLATAPAASPSRHVAARG